MNKENDGSFDNEEFFFGEETFYASKKDEIEENENQSATYKKESYDILNDAHTFVEAPLDNTVPDENNDGKTSKKKGFVSDIFEWLDVVVTSVVIVVVIFTFIFRIVAINGHSMNNTLFDGERVVITNMFYEPKKGDIVVISRNTENSSVAGSYEEPIIKRVIATEGDTVDIDFESGIVYVNNEALDEPYTKEPTYRKADVQFPLVVKENCVFVLGDNRNDSKDSRTSEIGDNGLVDVKYIVGHATLRVFPLNKFGGLN